MSFIGDMKSELLTIAMLATVAVAFPATVNASTVAPSTPNVSAQAADYYQDGKIGDVTYSFDDNDTGKTLVLNTGTSGVINSADVQRATASDDSQVNVFPWNNDAYRNVITKISIEGDAKLQLNGTAAEYFFANLPNLKEIDGMSNVVTTGATSMLAMFADDPLIKSIDVSHFDTTNVTDMQFMFSNDSLLNNLDVSGFKTDKVTDMSWMFSHSPQIAYLDVSNFHTQNVTTMESMFAEDTSLNHLDVSNFKTGNVTDMDSMFDQDPALTSIDVSNFDTQKVTNMRWMFVNDTGLSSIDVSKFNTANVTNMDAMFYYDTKLQRLDLSNFNTQKVTSMEGMLFGLFQLSELVLGPNTQLADNVQLGAPDGSDQWQAVAGGTIANPLGDRGYLPNDLVALYSGTKNKLETWVPYSKVTLKVKSPIYLYVGDHFDPKLAFISATNADGTEKNYDEAVADGMTDDLGNLDTSRAGHYFVTYTYHLRKATVEVIVLDKSVPTPTPGPTPTPNPTPTPSPSPEPTPHTTTQPATPEHVAAKGSAVYAINKIYLYRHTSFSKSGRLAEYVQKPRVYRPMFVVTGYARSTNGTLRYRVRDVNHLSKTAGKRGYITANWKYVRPVYYQSNHQTLTVINPRGVNAYKNANLTGKVKNYKQGTVLHVTKFVHHNLATRYVLNNGQYITGNRKLVNMGKHQQVHYVKVIKTINRYKTVNLTGQKKQIKEGTKIRIKNYDFSYAHDLNKAGALRYRIVGGYITGNSKYVRILK